MGKKGNAPRNIFGNKMEDFMFWDSANSNSFSAQYYLARLTELGMAMFEWKNLPKPIDWRFIEYMLFFNGQVLYSHDDELGEDIVTQVALSGKLDFYRVPFDRQAYADNGYHRNLTADNSVIIWNNLLRMPSYPAMLFYARKLWEIDRTIDINVKAQKTPIMILADEDERLALKNVYMQYDGNQPFIFGSKNLGLQDSIQALKTDAPYLADKLMELKNQTWNEALTYLGISNLNVQKKERLISDEAVRSMGGTIASRQSRLEMRREAAEMINDMFGTKIEVNYREDFRELDDEFALENATEGGGDKIIVRDLRTNNKNVQNQI